MIFKKDFVYRIDYSNDGMGYFYGIYQITIGWRCTFIYVFHEGSNKDWDLDTFTCGDSETREIIEMSHIDDFKETFPEYFL